MSLSDSADSEEEIEESYYRRSLSPEEEFEARYGESSAPFAHPWPCHSPVVAVLKALFVLLILLPIRIAIAFFLGASYLLLLIACTISVSQANTNGWRKQLLQKVGRFYLRLAFFIFGFSITHYGNRDKEAGTIVSNHLSWLDIFIYWMDYSPVFVAKESFAFLPFVGYLSRVFGCIYVKHPLDPPGEKETLISVKGKEKSSGALNIIQYQKALEKDRKLAPLLIFPEGTTTNGRFIIHFRKGAFVGGFPVQPVVLRYRYSRVSPTWESIPFPVHLFLLATQIMHRVEVIYLPIYRPNEKELEDPQLYADNVKECMAEALGVAPTQHTVKDKMDFHSEIRKGNISWTWDPANRTRKIWPSHDE